MRRVNLSNPSIEYDPADPEGFRAGMFRFGPQLGASDTGATLYEIPLTSTGSAFGRRRRWFQAA